MGTRCMSADIFSVRPTLTLIWQAYKLTAKIGARGYFETSAVTMEGLDTLFNHITRIGAR
jgi:hypothetical protein